MPDVDEHDTSLRVQVGIPDPTLSETLTIMRAITSRIMPARNAVTGRDRSGPARRASIAYWTLLALVTARTAVAQDERAPTTVATAKASPGIQDNSFLIEEAYNQDRGVVQHISSFVHPTRGSAFVYTFVQEWPVGGMRNQLSYSIPVIRSGDLGAPAGLGDISLNYRYQLGNNGSGWAMAPRLTLVVPSGAWRRGRGIGGVGYVAFLPASFELGQHFVTHANAGATFTPRARTIDRRAAAVDYTLGQSLVWLAHRNFNLLTELVWVRSERPGELDGTVRSSTLQLSPGIRTALNFSSGLQIVPGLALPIGLGASRGERSVFVYLSFEHPFANRP